MLFGLFGRIFAGKWQKNGDYLTVYNAVKSEWNLMGQSKNQGFSLLTFKCLLQNMEMLAFLREQAWRLL